MKTLGVMAFAPTHIVTAFAAIKTRMAQYKHRCVVIICRFPGQRDSDARDMSSLMYAMLARLPNIERIVEMSDEQMTTDFMLGQPVLIQYVKEKIDITLDEIYYAHDYVGLLHQFLCSTYPKATRICYGDSFGYIISRPDLHESIIQARIENNFLSILRRLGGAKHRQIKLPWMWTYFRRLQFNPDFIYAMMPVEIGYPQTRIAPLTVVPVETVHQCLRAISDALDIRKREDAILASLNEKEVILLLMENLSEARMSTPDNEIGLYMALIKPHLTPGCTVIVKCHPGSADTAWRLAALRQRLDHDIEMIPFPDDLKRYPLELFEKLVRRCKIASFSSFLLTARLLFGIKTSSGLTAEIINTYINQNYIIETVEDLERHSIFDQALEGWDHKSVILSSPLSLDIKLPDTMDVSFE